MREYAAAARATSIPAGESGRWMVHVRGNGIKRLGAPPPQRVLSNYHGGVLNRELGEVVMHDGFEELLQHYEFVRRAHGRVLVTGLGLGCVARGLLANPRVREVTVVERSSDVIRLVWPYMPSDPRRLILRYQDALEFVTHNLGEEWDCAWHDLWSDPQDGEPHLAVVHQHLMLELRSRVREQGAWNFPRWTRRLLNDHGGIRSRVV